MAGLFEFARASSFRSEARKRGGVVYVAGTRLALGEKARWMGAPERDRGVREGRPFAIPCRRNVLSCLMLL